MLNKFDPTPAGRSRFLRNVHKEPLRDRAIDVWGDDGPYLLEKLRAAYMTVEKGGPAQCEIWLRNIIRACRKIKGDREAIRRSRYADACIATLVNGQDDEDDARDTPLGAIIEKAMIGRDEALRLALRLMNELAWRISNDERRIEKVNYLLRSACRKKMPIKYLESIMLQEMEDRRRAGR